MRDDGPRGEAVKRIVRFAWIASMLLFVPAVLYLSEVWGLVAGAVFLGLGELYWRVK